jgi:hypothetical protein
MADAGTLLSELDGSSRPSDVDLVDSILSDLNQPSGGNPIMSTRNTGQGQGSLPPPSGVRNQIQSAQQQHPSTYPNAADPAVPTAHLIGRDHPTEADFQRMMMAAQGPLPFNAMAPQMQASVPQQPQQPAQPYEEPKKNWQGQWIDELKQPILVAIILFVMTLPAINLLISHYAPKLLRPGGDLTTIGMVARALCGGALYWVLQRVVAPLISL